MINYKKLFAKYLKERKASDHATLSASGAERWLGCPGSIRLSDGIPSVESDASIRGTDTHTLLQFILENPDWKDLLETTDGWRFRLAIDYDGAMKSNALFAAEYVWKEMDRLQLSTGKRPELFTEKKLELEGIGFGTSDIILYQSYGDLHVMDYKNGTKAVEPENNMQGLYYAHAAADLFNWEFSRLKITIIQPNAPHARGHIRTWQADHEDLENAGRRLKRGAIATRKLNAPLVANNEWCWFCPARQKCPKQQDARVNKIMERFGIGVSNDKEKESETWETI